MTRSVNAAGLALIKQREGCRLEAYQDQRGIWTIGYGHTRGVYPGMALSQDEADQALADDLAGAEAVVDGATEGAPTGDNQFAAMVSLCFNIGSANFRASSVLREHLAGDAAAAAADAFLMWDKTHIGGVLTEDPGLRDRRQAERTLYLAPDGAA